MYPCNPLNKTTMFGVDLRDYEPLKFCEDTKTVSEYTDMYFRGVPTTKQSIPCEMFCPSSCDTSYYTMSPSATPWPRAESREETDMKKLIRKRYQQVDFRSMTDEEELAWMHRTCLFLMVYFDSTDVETYVSSPKYDGAVLFSNFGGALGLCLGVSALTAVEILELIADFVCFLFRKLCSRGTRIVSPEI